MCCGQITAVRAEHGVGQRGLILVRPIGSECHRQLVGGFPQQLSADGLHVGSAKSVGRRVARLRIRRLRIDDERGLSIRRVCGVGDDIDPAGLLLRGHADRAQQGIRDQWDVSREPGIEPVVLPSRGGGDEALAIPGRMGDDADRAPDGIRPEQRSLRTLENLDAINVQQLQIRANRTGEVYTVQVDADARIQVEREVVLADAAYRCRQHRAVAGERRTGIEVDTRGQIAERVDIDQIAALQLIGGKRRNGDGHLLDVLAAFLGRDGDFLQHIGEGRRSDERRCDGGCNRAGRQAIAASVCRKNFP